MKKEMISALVLFGLAATADVNLFRNGDFKPARLGNEETSPQDWWQLDGGRSANISSGDQKKQYISGYQCFKLSFAPGTMTIRFLENAPAAYYKYKAGFWISNQSSVMPELTAPKYRIRGEYKLNKGSLRLLWLKTFPAAGNWRSIDETVTAQQYNARRRYFLLEIVPQPGLELNLRNFRAEPVYPPSKGKFIRLPDGGNLESLTLPEKASFDLHYLAAVWQSWLWRLTGVVLPIKEGGSGKNSLVFRKGDLPDGSWKIRIGSSGGELIYSREAVLWPALCEYLRKLGVVYYAKDCHKIPAENADLVLPAIDKTVNPRFHRYLLCGKYYGATDWEVSNGMNWYCQVTANGMHCFNNLLPMGLYQKDHPEYYMMLEDGSRYIPLNPGLVTPCLSNPEVQKIITENFSNQVRAAGHYDWHLLYLGDRPDFCHCPDCRKNGGSYSDIMMDMTNRLVRKAAKIRPDVKVQYGAYLNSHDAPKTVKPEKNVYVDVCMPPYNNPCSVHVNCERNRKPVDSLIGWSKLVGPDRTGLSLYEEERPFHFIERLEFYHKYAKFSLMLYSDDPQIFYIMSRWNMGDDGEQAIREFNDVYFGAGGKYVTQSQRMVEDFCKKYQHHPGDASEGFMVPFMSEIFGRKTILTRELFDRIYPLFDRALAAVGKKTSPERTHLLVVKYKFLRMDLAKYPYMECGNAAEVKAFAARLRSFVELCGELIPQKLTFNDNRTIKQHIFYGTTARKFIQMVAGVELPETVRDWTKEPALLDFVRNMESRLILKPQEILGGTLFMPGLMRGGEGPFENGYQCPKKLCKVIRRPSSGNGKIAVTLKLEKKPDAPLLLTAEGLDDDKPGASTMEVSVNGKVIFSGANTFEEHNWTKMIFTIPADCLKSGDNRIVFSNTVQDRKDKAKDDNEIYMGQTGIQDYRWGWIALSRIYVLDISSAFKDFLAGSPKSVWGKISWMNKPEGIIEIRDGKLFMQSKGAPFTGIHMTLPEPNSFYVTPGAKIRMTVTAQGSGRIGYWAYGTDKKYLGKQCTGSHVSCKELKKHSAVFTVGEGVAKITPYITATKNGLTVESLQIEIVR